MKAIEVHSQGSGYRLQLIDLMIPEPGKHEVLIEVAASGINRADLFQAEGSYPPPEGASPLLGLEVAGTIIKIGKNVGLHRVGDQVCALLPGGGYAEYASINEALALPIPGGLSVVEAAALPEALFTAYHNLFELGRLAPGENLLVHGGASGIGTMAIQLAKALGVTVFATAGTQEKCALCERLGATAINYKVHDFVEALKPHKMNLVLDIIGGDYFQKNFSVLDFKGRLICLSFLKGAKTEVNFGPLLMKNIHIMGSTLRSKTLLEKHLIAQSLKSVVWPLIEQGHIMPVIDSIFPISDTQKAHKRMKQNLNAGKILLKW